MTTQKITKTYLTYVMTTCDQLHASLLKAENVFKEAAKEELLKLDPNYTGEKSFFCTPDEDGYSWSIGWMRNSREVGMSLEKLVHEDDPEKRIAPELFEVGNKLIALHDITTDLKDKLNFVVHNLVKNLNDALGPLPTALATAKFIYNVMSEKNKEEAK